MKPAAEGVTHKSVAVAPSSMVKLNQETGPAPGSRTWIEQQAKLPVETTAQAAQTKKRLAREKLKRKRKEQKKLRQEEGWVRPLLATHSAGGASLTGVVQDCTI